jgi:hypothetical protein|eukprot:COSAG02_NODE_2872_length_7854_cov_57.759381_4_plen_54_part_00
MVIEVGGMPGGFNIIVALASSLDGPWSLCVSTQTVSTLSLLGPIVVSIVVKQC